MAVTIYVAKNGSDSNGGGADSPLATVSRALALLEGETDEAVIIVSGRIREEGGDTGMIEITGERLPSLIIRGKSGEEPGILDARGLGKSVIYIEYAGQVTLGKHLVITGGKSDAGGGVWLNGGSLILDGAEVRRNRAESGGGVYAVGGEFTMRDGLITQNAADKYDFDAAGGGGVFGDIIMEGGVVSENVNGGIYSADNSLVLIKGGVIERNKGSGVHVWCGNLRIEGGVIRGNVAKRGAGVRFSSGEFVMTGGEISGNSAMSQEGAAHGGGVYIEADTQATDETVFIMEGGSIKGNKCDIAGGGVTVVGSKFTMRGGEISGNYATIGGGVGVYTGGAFTFEGGSFADNSAESSAYNVALEGDGGCSFEGKDRLDDDDSYGWNTALTEGEAMDIHGGADPEEDEDPDYARDRDPRRAEAYGGDD